MATIDASIPLQVQTPQTNPAQSIEQAFTLADLVNKEKAQKELREIYSQPGAIDPQTGTLSKDALSQIMSADPNTGMAIQKNQADIAEKQSTTAKNTAQAKNFDYQNGAKQLDLIASTGGAIMNQYSKLLQQGVPRDQAIQQMQPVWQQAIQQVASTGQIDQQHLAAIPPQFDPDKVANGVFTALGTKGQFEVLHQQQQEQNEQQRLQETGRHNRVEEGQGSARISIEAENAGTNRGRLAFEESQPKSEIGKIGADYNAGRISKEDYNAGIAKATGQGDPATVDATARAIANYDIAPLTGNGIRTPGGMRTMARVMELNPNYDAKTYNAQNKAVQAFSTGKQGDIARSLNVATYHLDTLADLGKALGNGNVQAFNKLSQDLAEQTGKPAPKNFNAAKEIVGDEVVKAVVGSTGASADREKIKEAFSRAGSPQQLQGVINTYKNLMGGQLKGLSQQYQSSTGRNDFARRFLNRPGEDADAVSGGAPGPAPVGAAPLPGQGPAPGGAVRPPLPTGGVPQQAPAQATAPAAAPGGVRTPPNTNAQGWTLHRDAKGNMAYVSPDGKQFQQVQ